MLNKRSPFPAIWILVFLASYLSGQNRMTDSLVHVLHTPQADTNRIKALNMLAWELHSAKPDSALLLNTQAISLNVMPQGVSANEIRSRLKLQAVSYSDLGEFKRLQSNYAEALKYDEMALKIYEEIHFNKGITLCLNNMGIVCLNMSDYPKALEFAFRALRMDEVSGDKRSLASSLGTIGNIFMEQHENERAIEYYLKAMRANEVIGRKYGVAMQLANIANVYKAESKAELIKQGLNEKKKDSLTLDYYTRSLHVSEELQDKYGISRQLSNIGGVYKDEGDADSTLPRAEREKLYAKAFDYFTKALQMNEELGRKSGVVINLGNLGTLCQSRKQYKEAEKYLQKAIDLAIQVHEMEIVYELHRSLSEVYRQERLWEPALTHFAKYITLRDSIFNDKNTKKSLRAEVNFEFEKKRAAEKAEQDKRDTLAAAERQRQRLITITVCVGLLLVLVFFALLYNRFRLTQKQKKIIEEQKHLVDEKNKDITDSINYARRIQRSLLPPVSYFKKSLPEVFILYKPKDIVSGDFYWGQLLPESSANGPVFLLATADCTGHGVPGALMSMIGISKLSELVLERKVSRPDEILNQLREEVIRSLNPEGAEVEANDGMDISLCVFDFQKLSLQYSGANNSIYHVPASESVLKEYKADKFPVGKYSGDPKPFTCKEIKLERGDCVYAFTDGFADQFGGPNGKKFKYRQFEELLVSNRDKPLEQQKEILNSALESWKGGLEQVDDILVIGLRI